MDLGSVENFLVSAGEKQFAAKFAGAGAEIEDAVGGLDGVRVVFDDENGVAEIAKGFEDVDEALGVARMKTDGRLVENIERADQMGAERGGQLDALRFAAGERGGEAVESEVIEADFIEELQAGANFFEDFIGDFGLRLRQLQLAGKKLRASLTVSLQRSVMDCPVI